MYIYVCVCIHMTYVSPTPIWSKQSPNYIEHTVCLASVCMVYHEGQTYSDVFRCAFCTHWKHYPINIFSNFKLCLFNTFEHIWYLGCQNMLKCIQETKRVAQNWFIWTYFISYVSKNTFLKYFKTSVVVRSPNKNVAGTHFTSGPFYQ